MGETASLPTITTQLQRIAEQVKTYPEMVFTTLAHRMDMDFLREAYHRTRKDSAPGIEGMTAETYAEHREENLRDLHERLRSRRYQAPPVKRHWLSKADGSQRPIGLPTFEDKIVQRAVTMLLGAIYEEDFYSFSYGFRPGRSAHQALSALREQCREQGIQLDRGRGCEWIFRQLRSRQGYWVIKRRTAKKRLRRTLTALWQWCRSHRHRTVDEQPQELCQKLRGHYQYYGIRGNYRLLEVVMRHAERAWRYWLSRRSQKGTITGSKLEWWREHLPLPPPRIVHNI